jgi:hypothetical protein
LAGIRPNHAVYQQIKGSSSVHDAGIGPNGWWSGILVLGSVHPICPRSQYQSEKEAVIDIGHSG